MQFLPPPGSSLYIPLVVLYALTALSPVLFICLYLRERRSVFVGWLLIVTVEMCIRDSPKGGNSAADPAQPPWPQPSHR